MSNEAKSDELMFEFLTDVEEITSEDNLDELAIQELSDGKGDEE